MYSTGKLSSTGMLKEQLPDCWEGRFVVENGIIAIMQQVVKWGEMGWFYVLDGKLST